MFHNFKCSIPRQSYGIASQALQHLAQTVRSECWNPRAFHTYTDESHLGILKCIAQKCHKNTISMRVLQRFYLITSLAADDDIHITLDEDNSNSEDESDAEDSSDE